MSERVACTTRSTEKQAGASAGEADQHTTHKTTHTLTRTAPVQTVRWHGQARQHGIRAASLTCGSRLGVDHVSDISGCRRRRRGYHGTIQYAAPRRTRLCCRRKQPTARIDSAAIAVYCTMLPLTAFGLVLLIDKFVRRLAMLMNAFRQRDADALVFIDELVFDGLVFIDWVPPPANVADRPTRN